MLPKGKMETNFKSERIFVLIHGTWANNADWANAEDSMLKTSLRNLVGEGVQFIPFNWNGTNSHQARISAGSQLESTLLALLKDSPEAAIFLVSHSHGGNVAFYAMRNPLLRHRVRGIACLGTPFVACQPRNFDLFFPLIAGCVWLAIQVAEFIAIQFFLGRELTDVFIAVSLVILVGFFKIPLLITALLLNPLFPVLQRLNRKSRELWVALSLPRFSAPVFCANAVLDEAALGLKSTSWLANSSGRAFPWVLFLSAVPFILATFISYFIFFGIDGPMGGGSRTGKALALMAILGWLGLSLALLVVSHLIPHFIQGNLLSFGRLGLRKSSLLRVWPMSKPKRARLVTERNYAYPIWKFWHIRHSRLYTDDRVLSDLAQWIEHADDLRGNSRSA